MARRTSPVPPKTYVRHGAHPRRGLAGGRSAPRPRSQHQAGGLTNGKKTGAILALTPEEELDAQIDELLAAVAVAREAAAKAYEFSSGNAYAYAAVQACTKAAMLAKRILGDGHKTRLRRTQTTVRTPRQGEVRKSMDRFKAYCAPW